jgi:SAM-dependent methyltransferase
VPAESAASPTYVLTILYHGLVPATAEQFASPSLRILWPPSWWSLAFNHGFAPLLASGDKVYAEDKQRLLKDVEGRVLEVGPGAGHTVKYYNKSKVERVYGVEPFLAIHGELRKSIALAGMTDKYQIVSTGIDDTDQLQKAGIEEGQFDSVVCVQVLCSIPQPKAFLARVHRFLKPGGRLYLFEHVQSPDPISRGAQHIWTYAAWQHLFGGCQLNRPSGQWATQSGEWMHVDLGQASTDTPASLLPVRPATQFVWFR